MPFINWHSAVRFVYMACCRVCGGVGMPFINWHNWNPEEYHPNFRERALARKKRVKYTCEQCGVKRGETLVNTYGKPYKAMMAAAHVNHDPRNGRAKLIILCQRCHLRHDAPEHAKKQRRTIHRKKREAQISAGQLTLFKGWKKA
jgi:hypothetical protein